jgi:replicative DNA helicase
LDSIPLYIDETGWVTIDYLKRVSRRMIAKKKVKCIMIDHLQLIRSNKKSYSRVSELSDMTAELKILSKELQVPIILLSQLSRGVEERSDKRPQLSDLRESGSIEQDADICMFLYRDDYYNENTTSAGVTELLIRKHRSGAIGTVKLFFEKEFCRFVGIPEHQKY